MSTPALTYSVRDRSILLPYYKRFLVEPLLPAIPAWIHPNAITHGGHLINLGALLLLVLGSAYQPSGALYFVVPLLVHFWLWCDHADGGHARRVNKCSAKGEFLDHGLDLLNATYVICMTVVTLGTPPFWSVAAAVAVPAAAAIIYWEQAETGVFQLGLLNQIESVCSLTVALVARGIFGLAAIEGMHVGPVGLPVVILVFVTVVALFGMLRSAMRVAEKKGHLMPFFAPVAFGVALAAATATGALGTLSAIVSGAIVYVYVGVRSLEHRLRGQRPVVEKPVLLAAALFACLAAYRAGGHDVGPSTEWLAALAVSVGLGFLACVSARNGNREVERLDRAK